MGAILETNALNNKDIENVKVIKFSKNQQKFFQYIDTKGDKLNTEKNSKNLNTILYTKEEKNKRMSKK